MNFSETSRIFAWLFIIMIILLLVGTLGFRHISRISWIDSFHSSAMYVSGLGPLTVVETNEAKLFSSIYALMSGIFFIALAAAFIQRITSINLFETIPSDKEEKKKK